MEEKTHTCGLCHYEFRVGATVCQGCQGRIVYGASGWEESESGKAWAFLLVVVAALLVYLLPDAIQEYTDFSVTRAWGLGFWSLIPLILAAIVGYIVGIVKASNKYDGKIRTFRYDITNRV